MVAKPRPRAIPFLHHDVPISFLGLGASQDPFHRRRLRGLSDRPLGCAGGRHGRSRQDRRIKGGLRLKWRPLNAQTPTGLSGEFGWVATGKCRLKIGIEVCKPHIIRRMYSIRLTAHFSCVSISDLIQMVPYTVKNQILSHTSAPSLPLPPFPSFHPLHLPIPGKSDANAPLPIEHRAYRFFALSFLHSLHLH